MTDFLFRLRNLVTVKEGVLEATGRLYTLDVLDLHEQPTERFPKIQAMLTISAYSFGAAPAAAGVAPATTAPRRPRRRGRPDRGDHDRAGPCRRRRGHDGSGGLAMAKKKSEDILRKRKEAKQKKLLFVLGPIFLLLMVWQGPGYVKMLTGGSSRADRGDHEHADGNRRDARSGLGGPTVDGRTRSQRRPAAPPAAGAIALADSDQPLAADTGQLISFGRFLSKDPFKQGVTPPPTSDGTAPAEGGTGSTGSGGSSGGTVVPPPAGTRRERRRRFRRGRGLQHRVERRHQGQRHDRVRDPEYAVSSDDPLFQLVSLTNTTAKIGLVSGSFSNGKKTVTLKLGKVLTLVSEPDGLRYRLKLIRSSFSLG